MSIAGGYSSAKSRNNVIVSVGDDFIDNYGAKVSLFGGTGNDTIFNKTSYTQAETRQVTRTKQVKEYEYKEVEVQ